MPHSISALKCGKTYLSGMTDRNHFESHTIPLLMEVFVTTVGNGGVVVDDILALNGTADTLVDGVAAALEVTRVVVVVSVDDTVDSVATMSSKTKQPANVTNQKVFIALFLCWLQNLQVEN